MKYLVITILSLLMVNCSAPAKKESKKDIFEELLSLKGKTRKELISILGNPQESKIDKNQEETLTFKKDYTFDIFLDSKNIVQSASLWFWQKGFDNYLFLKKRFKGYKWEEKELPPIQSDYVNEPYEVKIPELGIEFEYDNQDPQRRPMNIFFKLN